MKQLLALLAIVFSVVSAQATGTTETSSTSSSSSTTAAGTNNNEFDFLLLTQGWPGTACQIDSCVNSQLEGASRSWLVHGLWPEYADGTFPQMCGLGPAFNPHDNVFTEHKADLAEFWPSLYGPSMSFWEHEYEKHARCATSVFSSQEAFFKSVLMLRQKYDLLAVLQAKGITPSDTNTYGLEAISQAINSTYGHEPVFMCKPEKAVATTASSPTAESLDTNPFEAFYQLNKRKRQRYNPESKPGGSLDGQIWEIWLCFDKTLTLIECPASFVKIHNAQSNCKHKQQLEDQITEDFVGIPQSDVDTRIQYPLWPLQD